MVAIRLSRAAGGALIALGGLVLLGWYFDVALLKSLRPSFVSMRPNTAVLFVLTGWGISTANRVESRARVVLALAITLAAAATVVEYLLGVDLAIDDLVLRAMRLAAQDRTLGRPALATAACFLLLGLGLLSFRRASRLRLTGVVVGLVWLVAFTSLCGYLFGAGSLYRVVGLTSIAPHTTVGLLVACAGLVLARPDVGLAALVVSPTSGGSLVRRFLPLVTGLPIVLSWLRLRGQDAGFYDTRFGVGISTVTSAILLSAAILYTARSLRDSEERRRHLESELMASEEMYRDLYDNAPDMCLSADFPDGTIRLCNDTLARRLGYSRHELLGRNVRDLHPDDLLSALDGDLVVMERTGELRDANRVLRCKDGRTVEVSLTLKAVRDAHDRTVATWAIWRDVSERRQNERDQAFLIQLADAAGALRSSRDLAEVVCTRVGDYLNVNRCLLAEVDRGSDAVIVRAAMARDVPDAKGSYPLSQYNPETLSAMESGIAQISADTHQDPRTAARYEVAHQSAGIGAMISIPLSREGKWIASFHVSTIGPRAWTEREVKLLRNVAERTWTWLEHLRVSEALRQREGELRALNVDLEHRVSLRTAELSDRLKERDVLLQEIHHRVKNNLQVISSLINMQVRRVADQQSRVALEECQTRVGAIALIHEKLYRSRDYARVPFDEYARSLAATIFQVTGVSADRVRLQVDMEPIALPVEQAIPCGLILNELVTNALKHAFPNGRSGVLHLELRRPDAHHVELAVSDDGKGAPAELSPARSSTLGMQIISTLVEQLEGELEIVRGRGTSFRVRFPLPGPALARAPLNDQHGART